MRSNKKRWAKEVKNKKLISRIETMLGRNMSVPNVTSNSTERILGKRLSMLRKFNEVNSLKVRKFKK